ncbi:MAG TPA: UDP-2,3-diacylglucosamine diphosphatase LpxI [Terriglobales bacterium]
MSPENKLGLIAGNGSFPLLLLDAARAQGAEVIVAAIKEETSPLIEQRGAARVHWMSLGELGKLIDTFKREGVRTAVMAGQVKHKQIFSAIRPDWRLAKVLFSLGTRNTDSLIGAVAKVLEEEGIHLISSTSYLEPLLAKPGVLTRRAPSHAEQKNVAYGRQVALHLAQYDIGQTVVIAESACVAVEAMEGTDATILRAGEIMKSMEESSVGETAGLAGSGNPSMEAGGSTTLLSRALTVVKVAKPNQDMRFDVPVIGVKTIETMAQAGATCLAVDAGKCLFLDGAGVIDAADRKGVAVIAGGG